MLYKLVAIDCDNTLINSTGHIPEKNISVIQKLQKKGIKFVLVTGRNDIYVKDYLNELGIKAPVIGCNGASIRNLFDNTVYKLSFINREARQEVFSYCNKNNIPLKMFSINTFYSIKNDEEKNNINSILNLYTKQLSESLEYISLKSLDEAVENDELIKLVIVNDNPNKIEKIQCDLKKIGNFEIVRSARNCLDIINKGVSKGNSLIEYANMLNISKKEIIAFGDSENDYQMLKIAGFSVAMGNGEECLKEIADMVTLTNNEAGVAYALIKIFNALL